ncbi:helicase associated domain-containing protein [Streptomyces flaveolus]|uniref:helicase associated domain-containing protein n=1 Tax=Streptomyces flaveolus TaxID=67297 RepID=UPI0033AC03F8
MPDRWPPKPPDGSLAAPQRPRARFPRRRAVRRSPRSCGPLLACSWPIRLPLGRWLADQRRYYNAGTLEASRVKQLDKLGMVWRGTGYGRRGEWTPHGR